MFAVLGFMFGGVLLGFFLRKTPLLKYLNHSILVTICLLLLMLGMSVGNNPSIVGNLQTLGAKALLVAAVTTLGSALAGWLVWTLAFKKEKNGDEER